MDSGFRRGVFSISEYIDKGFINDKTFEASSSPDLIFEIVRKEQIDSLMENFTVSRLHFIATDLYTNHMRDAVDAMSAELFELYLKYHFAVCERSDMIGLTHHSLDIFRKEK